MPPPRGASFEEWSKAKGIGQTQTERADIAPAVVPEALCLLEIEACIDIIPGCQFQQYADLRAIGETGGFVCVRICVVA